MPKSDTQFKPGQSGNPKGRPKGARSKLGSAFIKTLRNDFKEFGAEVIQSLREKDPAAYARVVASLLPKQREVSGTVEHTHTHIAVSEVDQRIEGLLGRSKNSNGAAARPH